MITDHVWRPLKQRAARSRALPCPDACAFMNCRKPQNQHQRSITRGWHS